MSRRNAAQVRQVLPDPVYNRTDVTKLINQVMLDGKRTVAQKIVYEALENGAKKLGCSPAELWDKALENVKPVLEVKPRRVGGSTYQVPIEIRPARRQTLAIRWIVDSARTRSDRTMAARLCGELMDAYNQAGGAFKKKEEVHRMAEANKAFASFRW
jgi:small subunit ribosomal protein S7